MTLNLGKMTRPKLPSDVIIREPETEISRETVTVLAGSGAERALEVGTVLGQITASSKVVALDPAGDDGSQTAYGVLVTNTTAPDGADADGVAITSLAALRSAGLIWPAGITANQKAAALAALKAKLIVAR